MAKLSIREAAKHFEASRPTITKALKSGKITGVQDDQGAWHIDPAELARVYKPRTGLPVNEERQPLTGLTSANTPLAGEIEALRERLAEAEKRAAVAEAEKRASEALAEERARHLEESARHLEQRDQHIEDLRRMLPPPAPITPPAPTPDPVPPRQAWRWPWS